MGQVEVLAGTSDPGRSLDGLFFSTGELVSCFEITGLIAAGGMSQVFEARDVRLNRAVALKAAEIESFAGSLLRKEGQALAAVRNPAVPTVFGMGVTRGIEYLVMERIAGTSLATLLELRGGGAPFAIAATINLLADVAAGLVAIHEAGIAHRDIKPENILLAPAGRVVLLDFGIFHPQSEALPEHVMGTPQYMAPEAARNRIEPGSVHLVDLYALGVLAFELLCGAPPFDGDDSSDILDQHVRAPIPDLLLRRPDVPVPLAQLVRELLAKNPRDRVVSAEAALWRLRAIERDLRGRRRVRTVLVVDDDPDAASLIATTVERVVRGATVVVAADAKSALKAIARQRPDLILLDLEMPGQNGIELAMYLRGTDVAPDCPIISVSARAEAGDVDLLSRLGVRHFVQKGQGLPGRLGAALRAVYSADTPIPW